MTDEHTKGAISKTKQVQGDAQKGLGDVQDAVRGPKDKPASLVSMRAASSSMCSPASGPGRRASRCSPSTWARARPSTSCGTGARARDRAPASHARVRPARPGSG